MARSLMPAEITRNALLSPDGCYRYSLIREWGGEYGSRATFIMLNPSVADAEVDDPTIRRCMGFARNWGHSGLTVVNVYALIATDPRRLAAAEDPVGPQNDEILQATLAVARKRGFPVIAAWGANKAMVTRRVRKIVEFAGPGGLGCLGTNADGSPKHPLRLRGDTELRTWEPPS